MDACWFVETFVEIAKMFWCDRHRRLRKGSTASAAAGIDVL